MYKRFFSADAQPDRGGEGIRLSTLQKILVEILRRNPGSAQRDLALQAGVTQQTVSYNLRILQKQGILQTVSRGRRQVYLTADGSPPPALFGPTPFHNAVPSWFNTVPRI